MPEQRPMPLTPEERIERDLLLGEVVDNFPSRRLRVLVSGWAVLLGSGTLFNFALLPWLGSEWSGPLFGLGVGMMGLVIGWRVMHYWNREVILYEHGFRYREGSYHVPFRYDEIKTIRLRAERWVYLGVIRRNQYEIRLTTYGGDVIRLTDVYHRIETLSDSLTERIHPLLRKAHALTLSQGEAIEFGSGLKLGTEGLSVSQNVLQDATADAHLAWANFGGYRIQDRQLQLLTHEQQVWFAPSLSALDNITLLIEFMKQKSP